MSEPLQLSAAAEELLEVFKAAFNEQVQRGFDPLVAAEAMTHVGFGAWMQMEGMAKVGGLMIITGTQLAKQAIAEAEQVRIEAEQAAAPKH